jgi:hypothetical protein
MPQWCLMLRCSADPMAHPKKVRRRRSRPGRLRAFPDVVLREVRPAQPVRPAQSSGQRST